MIDFFFEVFLKDEPIAKHTQGWKNRNPSVVNMVKEVISDGVSLMAIDSNGKLAGIRISFTVHR